MEGEYEKTLSALAGEDMIIEELPVDEEITIGTPSDDEKFGEESDN